MTLELSNGELCEDPVSALLLKNFFTWGSAVSLPNHEGTTYTFDDCVT